MDFSRGEYELQHFNFSVEHFQTEHRLQVKHQIEYLTKRLSENVILETKCSEAAAEEIRKSVDILVETVYNSVEGNLKEFDHLIKTHFSIPDNVLLHEDFKHSQQYTEEDKRFYEEKLAEFEKIYKQNAYFLSALEAEMKIYTEIQHILKAEEDLADEVDTALNIKLDDINETFSTVEKVIKTKKFV